MNEQKLEGLYCEAFLVAAETFYPMACSLTAGLCSFASQTALLCALPAVLSLPPQAVSFSPPRTPHELQGQSHHPGFGEALASFLLCVIIVCANFFSWRLKLTGTVHVPSV